MKAGAYGLDADRVGPGEGPARRLRRRWEGRFSVDPFGADPLLQDAVAAALARIRAVAVDVSGAAALPEIGPALLVANTRPGAGDVVAVRTAVRQVRRRRARVVGYPELPGVGGIARRLGHVKGRGEDVGAILRAGHVAVLGLTPALGGRAGRAAVDVVYGALGFPVVPVAVTGGPVPALGVPVGRHRVRVGRPLALDVVPRDPLSAAELAEAAREAVQALLDAR